MPAIEFFLRIVFVIVCNVPHSLVGMFINLDLGKLKFPSSSFLKNNSTQAFRCRCCLWALNCEAHAAHTIAWYIVQVLILAPKVLGCAAQPSSYLLKHTRYYGKWKNDLLRKLEWQYALGYKLVLESVYCKWEVLFICIRVIKSMIYLQ